MGSAWFTLLSVLRPLRKRTCGREIWPFRVFLWPEHRALYISPFGGFRHLVSQCLCCLRQLACSAGKVDNTILVLVIPVSNPTPPHPPNPTSPRNFSVTPATVAGGSYDFASAGQGLSASRFASCLRPGFFRSGPDPNRFLGSGLPTKEIGNTNFQKANFRSEGQSLSGKHQVFGLTARSEVSFTQKAGFPFWFPSQPTPRPSKGEIPLWEKATDPC